MVRLLLFTLMACTTFPEAEIDGAGPVLTDVDPEHLRTIDEARADLEASRRPRDGGLPPRRVRTPTADNGAGAQGAPVCEEGVPRWRSVPCESWGFPSDYDDVCYFSAHEDRLILPRCMVDVCGDPFWSETFETEIFPQMIQLRDCPATMAGGDLDDVGIRRRR